MRLDFGICAPKSAEDEEISSLFMSQTDSDIAFKIEEKVIPAHKSVLIKKSKYFKNVFNSGMAESRQDVIEIKDCEYETFKEYLRFIYQDTVSFDDINRTIKLYTLADKYLQKDLPKKCLNYLTYSINIENVYAIIDFAHQADIPPLKDWCLKFFEDNLNIENIAGLIEYLLDGQEDQYFKEDRQELIEKALNFTMDKYSTMYESEKGNMKLYERFLIKNIEMDTIPSFVKFMSGLHTLPEEKKLCFEECTSQLKESVFRFVQENIEIIMTGEISKSFPIDFFRDFTLYQGKQMKKSQKRMEPTRDETNEENPGLKKTKKFDSAHGN